VENITTILFSENMPGKNWGKRGNGKSKRVRGTFLSGSIPREKGKLWDLEVHESSPLTPDHP